MTKLPKKGAAMTPAEVDIRAPNEVRADEDEMVEELIEFWKVGISLVLIP